MRAWLQKAKKKEEAKKAEAPAVEIPASTTPLTTEPTAETLVQSVESEQRGEDGLETEPALSKQQGVDGTVRATSVASQSQEVS